LTPRANKPARAKNPIFSNDIDGLPEVNQLLILEMVAAKAK
jgi:hypothetical protein